MNTEAIDLLIKKNPKLKRSRNVLETMKTGAYCVHRSWGLGKIKDYDQKSGKLIIDFEDGKKDHGMDPAFCINRLEILPADSLMVKSIEDPGAVEAMSKESPEDIIAEILKTAPEHQASNSEIEKQLGRILGPRKYKKWWTTTKKLLVKDPRIAVPTKKTDPYILREIPKKAEDEILEEFFETRAPKKKIALADKLLALSVKHDDIKESLPEILKTLTDSLKETKQLDEGERLHGIWVRNDLARFIHEDPESIEPTSASLLKSSSNLSKLAELIPGTYYSRFLNLIERTFPEDWQRIHFSLLRNSSGKFTNEVINYLLENELDETITETLSKWLDEQNIQGSLLFWIIKNRNSRKYSKLVVNLISPRLLSAIFYAIDHEALQNASTRRIPLAEYLVDEPELIGQLLEEADLETAHDLATTLMLNQGFEDLSKKSLLARFIKRFPQIQSIVSGEGTQEKSEALVVSKVSFENRKAEYDDLIQNKIPANKEAIAIAREHGDLKENSEYKMARQDQDTLLSRKNQLEMDLARAQITDFSDAPEDTVSIGNIVEIIQSATNEKVEYSILGAWDSNPENNVLSYETPLAQNLIGKKTGDTVSFEIDGNMEEWTISKISRWIDRQS